MTILAQSPFTGFSKLNRQQRLDTLGALGYLSQTQIELLQQSSSADFIHLADNLVENTLGCFPMPYGLAVNFVIDGQERIIPMVVEETSVIAAACAAAKFIRQHGSIHTSIQGDCIIGQIHVPSIKDFSSLNKLLKQHQARIISLCHQQILNSLVARGGGIRELTLRRIRHPEAGDMAVIHVHLNPCDAMGANYVTQACEFIKQHLQTISTEAFGMAIVSNLSDTKLTEVTIELNNIDSQLGEQIMQASFFAECDPYRAATHNKGVINGIDPILIATGNDWRAVNAAIHAYASRNGQYQAISRWRYQQHTLTGQLTIPVPLGTVGGVTRLHPMAQLSLDILGVEQANDLARIVAAAGLVENFASLRALVQEGLSQGHMNLHIDNLIFSLNIEASLQATLKQQLQQHLQQTGKVSLSDAKHLYHILAK